MRILKVSFVIVAAIAAMGLNSARADQPHMRRALEHLHAARAELQSAEHDKGGWRMRAIRNVDQAIADTERGMRFDRRH
jgi:hypothetical protein